MERNITQEILGVSTKLKSIEDKENHLTKIIIPAMNNRRGRESNLSEEGISKKLWSPPASEKPGEEHEWAKAVVENHDQILSVNEALEIADIVYYYYQPNTPQKASKNKLENFIFVVLGDMSLALDFAIIKYVTRLKFGDEKNYKEIESYVMRSFFERKNLPRSLIKKDL